MPEYKLGDKTFKRKGDARKFVSEYLKKTIDIPKEDYPWLLDLFSRHYDWERKGAEFKSIEIADDGYGTGTQCFWLINKEGVREKISIGKCFSGKPPTKEMLMKIALRYHIMDQIRDFKNNFFDGETKNCEICKCEILNDMNTHVDHVIKFRDLVVRFLKSRDVEVLDTIWNEELDRWILEDNTRILWEHFHKKNCELRCLCHPCNLKLH